MDIFNTTNLVLVCIFGLIIGSFLSVCIYRIPLGRKKGLESLDEPEEEPQFAPGEEQISILKPARSFCPECKAQLKWYHNIPLFSWFLVGGKCAFCKHPISVRYPIIEAMTAASAVACYLTYGSALSIPTALLVFAFLCALIVISFIDIDYFIIPNVISIPGTVIGMVIGCINQFTHIFQPPVAQTLLDSILGILAGGGVLYGIAALYYLVRRQTGLGLGDVKLLMMTGALFGWESAFYTMFVGSLIGAVLGVTGMLIFRHKANRPMPFGPYLAVAATLYLFSGVNLLFWLRAQMESLVQLVFGSV